ncbi:MAG: type IX secretion system membrane protein PorP/SprF [Marinilabiliales bacterium]|nr:type IX secretion system membrane protein PorP/SprF [Marinilabiliales bacterium]
MKKVRTVILAFNYSTVCMVSGQQDPVLSHYMFNTQTYNPGYSGMSGMITATALDTAAMGWVSRSTHPP